MDNCCIFKACREGDILLEQYHTHLLTYIGEELGKRGVKCTAIKPDFLFPSITCKHAGKDVKVAIYKLGNPKAPLKGGLGCINTAGFWRRHRKGFSHDAGAELEYVCDAVKEIVSADARFSDVEWMPYDQWLRELFGSFSDGTPH